MRLVAERAMEYGIVPSDPEGIITSWKRVPDASMLIPMRK